MLTCFTYYNLFNQIYIFEYNKRQKFRHVFFIKPNIVSQEGISFVTYLVIV